MGSSESKPNSPRQQQAQEQARSGDDEENLLRQKARLEEKKIQWQQQQIRVQHWKEIQLREEQKQKEPMLQWQQRDKLKTLSKELLLRSEKQKLQDQEKESLQNVQLENKKLQEQLEKERLQNAQLEKQKLQEQLEKERLQNVQLEKEKLHNAQLEENRLLLQQLRVHQQQPVCAATAPAVTPLASSGMRETVALQQKASPCTAASPSSSIASRQTIAAQQKSLSAAQPTVKNLPKSKETPKSYLMRMNESNVKCNEWSIIDYIKDENFISKQVSENLFKLFCDNNTIPFIARYRRHLTQGMNEDKLRKARHSYDQAKLIKQRAITIVKDIDNKGRWTPEFHALVHETKSLDDLEYIHSIFKTKSKIKQIATKNGLEIVADNCLKGKTPPIAHLVQESVEGLKTQEQVKDGIICLLVDIIIKDRRTFKIIKELRLTHQFEIQTVKGKEADKLKKHENIYEPYYNFTLSEHGLKPDQVRDINKGEALKALSVKVIIPKEFECEFKKQCLQQYGFLGNPPSAQKTLVDAAVNFAYIGSIKGSVAKRVRKEISDKAAFAAVDHLAKKLASYMLAPPVRGKVVIGINPGFQNGCKFAVVSEQGYVVDTGTIYPNVNNPKGKHEAERVLVKMICQHKCKIIAMGNGKASKETTVFLTYIIKKNKKIPSDVFFTIVDQSSTSIYSYSRAVALEFPGVQNEIASAVSIARRLQDPVAELVKIEAEQLMVEKQHQEVYQQLIVEMVSYVGVDVNTASLSLLKRVAGLDEAKANSIIEWRKSSGPFTNRNDLLNVKGINKSIFEQCAGFIRILPATAVAIGGQAVSQDSFNYLDQTWIHPESYDIAKSFLEAANHNVLQLGTSNFIFTVNLYARTGYSILAKRFGTTEETIEMIVQGLRIEKGEDIRGKEDSNMFCRSLIRFNDLNNGVLLTGVVTRLAEFGAFVDVNAEIDGLIHKSCMNGLTVKADQKVEVRVSNIQKERGRLGLTLLRCV